ncbi:MAG: phosphoglucomutase, partial [Candidatus Neomarinimicrobiota bacterium]
MKSETIHFGTDGWRGLLDSEMNMASVSLVAQAFADYLKNKTADKNPSCVIGYDGRRYSPEFAERFAEILSGNGIMTFLSDRVIPTPVISYTVKHRKQSAGVMVTASHNPPAYNGIKFKGAYGGPFFTEETQKVETLLGKSPVKQSRNNMSVNNLLPDYLAHVESNINFDMIRTSGISCVADSMHGAGGSILPDLLTRKGCTAVGLDPESLPDFGGRAAEPLEKNLVPLKNYLTGKPDFSLGLATDGDADRLGVMMNGGNWLSAQETILLLADYLIRVKQIPGAIVKSSSVTDKLRMLYESPERPVLDVQVGFKYITEKMLEMPVALGVEESGGFGYGLHIPERDGIFSALLFLEMLAFSGYKNLSDKVKHFRGEVGNLYYDRIDYHFDKPGRTSVLPELILNGIRTVNGFPVRSTDTYFSSRGVVNGVKIRLKGDCRWLLIRSSETEPMMRIYAEGQSEREVKTFLNIG